MSSQLWRGVVKLTPNTLLLPKNVGANKILAQTLTLASSTRKVPISGSKVLLVQGIKQVQSGQFKLQYALISTSKKKEDGTAITADTATTAADKVDATTTATSSKRTWTSYGFDWESEENDRNFAYMTFFWTITVGICFTGFALAYWPDVKYKDWSQREAYIELARREALGLPLIDPDLIPIDKFELPTEEELGDFEIII